MPSDSNTVVLFVRAIPRNVRDQFKAACCRRGLTMTKVISDMMRKFAKDELKVHLPNKRAKNRLRDTETLE